tara:strand:+ start:894 stop:1634 length:741 start_codon:yes stop_codon:yes gene_type:complete
MLPNIKDLRDIPYMNCISCNTDHNSNFCPNCGEKAGIKKITFRSIATDSFSSITTMDKGFLFNLKMLLLNPRSITIEYILGKRKGILNPISFLILSVSLYLILEGLLKVPKEIGSENKVPDTYMRQVAFTGGLYLHKYFKYFWVLAIIPLGLSTRLLFGKYNFTEHLTINAFILGQATMVGLLAHIILRTNLVFNPFVYAVLLVLTFRVFLTKNEGFESFFKALLVVLFFIIELLAIALGLGVIFI